MDRKLLNLPQERILWVDLELSGLSLEDDVILEVAAVVTDWDFKEIDTYHGVVKNKVSYIKNRMTYYVSYWDNQPEARDGLLKQNSSGKTLGKIEKELIRFVNKNFKPRVPVLLGGSSVHVDRRFIIANWPKLNSKLHYRMLDVSAWKVVFEGKFKKSFAKRGVHRALDDIRGSIEELQYYLTKLK